MGPVRNGKEVLTRLLVVDRDIQRVLGLY